MAIAQLSSRIETVKVYSAGATVTRIAEFPLTPGELPEHVEIAGLPLALDDSSVRVRVEVEQGTAPLACDVRIGLAVPPPPETSNPPADEEIRAAAAEVQQIQDAIALIDNEISVLRQLHVPDRPNAEPGKAPPPSPMSARLALANFSDEQIRARIQEKRENAEKLRKAEEHLADLQQKQRQASTARDARPNELRKTVIVRLSYEGTPSTEQVPRLVVEYFVPGARWTPTYVCRINSAESSASIAVRALICQRTGEDWTGVRLELSTAEPMAWCALPELPSLRLGRSQSVLRKSGWRRPPIGAEILFEEFDRQKNEAIAAAPKPPALANIRPLFRPPLPNPLPKYQPPQKAEAKESMARARQVMAKTAPAVNKFDYDIGLISPDMMEESLDTMDSLDMMEEEYDETAAIRDVDFGDLAAMLDEEDEEPQDAQALYSMAPLRPQAPSVKMARSNMGEPSLRGDFRGRGITFSQRKDEGSQADLLAYGLMRMGAADDPAKRGKLSIEQQQEAYLEILKRQEIVVRFNVVYEVQKAVLNAQNCLSVSLPPGGIDVRHVAGSFDYAYSADGRVDVSSDGQFHSVALTSKSTDVDLRYIVVPREDTNVFRIAQLRNPLQAPLLAGPADVYVNGEYILSTNIATVPPKGQMELGLGVEQAIKVARNTSYDEVRSGETIVAFNELRHKIKIDITNLLPREAKIEVRERLPIPQEGAKVDVQINQVTPAWEKYKQEERSAPIRGGYRWRVEVSAKEQETLEVDYTVKTFVDSELIGGNRREG
jgi:hypothetical protein